MPLQEAVPCVVLRNVSTHKLRPSTKSLATEWQRKKNVHVQSLQWICFYDCFLFVVEC